MQTPELGLFLLLFVFWVNLKGKQERNRSKRIFYLICGQIVIRKIIMKLRCCTMLNKRKKSQKANKVEIIKWAKKAKNRTKNSPWLNEGFLLAIAEAKKTAALFSDHSPDQPQQQEILYFQSIVEFQAMEVKLIRWVVKLKNRNSFSKNFCSLSQQTHLLFSDFSSFPAVSLAFLSFLRAFWPFELWFFLLVLPSIFLSFSSPSCCPLCCLSLFISSLFFSSGSFSFFLRVWLFNVLICTLSFFSFILHSCCLSLSFLLFSSSFSFVSWPSFS